MSRSSGNDFKEGCLEQSKDEKTEVIHELREKMHRLKFRLLDTQNQNQMLRKELLMAKKVVDEEMNCELSEGAKGREKEANALRQHIADLQVRILELEERTPHYSKRTNQPKQKILTRQQKNFDHEVFENCSKIKRKIEYWSVRNKDLKADSDMLRLELSRLTQKSKENQEVQGTYMQVEKELRDSQNEKLDLRSKLSRTKTRNQYLVEELNMLKEDLEKNCSKMNDDDKLLEALMSQQKTFQDLIDRQKLMGNDNHRRYVEDLKELQNKHVSSAATVSEVQELMEEDNVLQQTLKDVTPLLIYTYEKNMKIPEETVSLSGSLESENSRADDTEEPMQTADAVPHQLDTEMQELKEGCDKHRSLFESAQEEVERFTEIVHSNSLRLNEWMDQLLHSKIQDVQKNAEIRNLEETLKRLESTTSNQNSKSRMEELISKKDVLKEENKFLLELWRTVASVAVNFFEMYTTTSDRTRKIFVDGIRELRKN